jgi:hypothetical protein
MNWSLLQAFVFWTVCPEDDIQTANKRAEQREQQNKKIDHKVTQISKVEQTDEKHK